MIYITTIDTTAGDGGDGDGDGDGDGNGDGDGELTMSSHLISLHQHHAGFDREFSAFQSCLRSFIIHFEMKGFNIGDGIGDGCAGCAWFQAVEDNAVVTRVQFIRNIIIRLLNVNAMITHLFIR